MFSQGKKAIPLDLEKTDTLIGRNTTFEGTIQAEGTVRIDGNIVGEVTVTGNIIIGENSTVKGNIKADNAYIAGTVEGNVTAKSQLHLTSSAKLNGDIYVKNIVIDEGAVFIGGSKAFTEDK